MTLEEHVARVAENAGRDDVTRRLIDEGPAPIAGTDAWWTIESAMGSPAQFVERWMLVRDGVGWTVTVQIPWADLHNLRAGAHAIVGTLRFRDGEGGA